MVCSIKDTVVSIFTYVGEENYAERHKVIENRAVNDSENLINSIQNSIAGSLFISNFK